MRYVTGTILSALLICAVNAQQTGQLPQKTQPGTSVAAAPSQPQPAPPAQNPNGLSVVRGIICMDISEHEPAGQGEIFPPQVKRLYCFTQIKSSGDPAEIQHRWYWKDELMSAITLKITSANFRTFSAKSIPESATGDWRVAIVNSKNEELIQMIKFYIK